MTAPNRNTLWARAFVDELVAAGVDAVCAAPGSRSTPLTLAFARTDDVQVFSHLDERSAAYFALGRGKRTGRVTPVLSTSGTATANFHPAVMEADRGRVPLLVLTADRPPELQDSGANQTADQTKLYGDAVRWFQQVGEPEAEDRKLRSLRTTAARAVRAAEGVPPGPVHLDFPFRKPLEPTLVEGDVPADFAERYSLAAAGRDGPYVRTATGRAVPDEETLADLERAVADADTGLLIAGPSGAPPGGPTAPAPAAVADLAAATGFPVLADPLSGVRFGPHVADAPVFGGYDAYLDPGVTDAWPVVDVAFRFGASPTSKALRRYLARAADRQVVVDAGGQWTEAEFAATDLLAADPTAVCAALSDRVDRDPATDWHRRFERAEATHRAVVDGADAEFEGAVLATVAASAPDPSTVVVSNSMPVRDLDRFGAPRAADLTVLGNRGVSGIDGVTSTALGAGSATGDPLVFVTGDLAYYHDMNGLLALDRCDVDATVVLVNNDGGGIFQMLPVADHESFEAQFRTPHGLDFAATADLYGLTFNRTRTLAGFREAFRAAVETPGTQVLEVRTDAASSHRTRERLAERVRERLATG